MDAEVFEAAWASYKMRSELERLEVDQRAMIAALYSNSALGGKDLEKAIESIRESYRNYRHDVISSYKGDDEADEATTSGEASEGFLTEKWW